MKVVVNLDSQDIRQSISEWIRKYHPEMCKGKSMSVVFTNPVSAVSATVTIDDTPQYRDPRD